MEESTRILVIDDDPGIREAYAAILCPAQASSIVSKGDVLFGSGKKEPANRFMAVYDLSIASESEEGIRMVEAAAIKKEPPFAVAFVDMKMPGMGGTEAVNRIWDIDPDIRMVVVTAYSECTPTDIMGATGRDDLFYLRKPFNPEEITQFARALTNEWRSCRDRKRLAAILEEANRNLRRKVEQQAAMIVQSEKMTSIGILAAGVAHEINNPIAFVKGNMSTMRTYNEILATLIGMYRDERKNQGDESDAVRRMIEFEEEHQIDFVLEDMDALVDESLSGVERIQGIVKDLRTFSRVDEAENRCIDINESLRATLKMLHRKLAPDIDVKTDFGELPGVFCYARKISQVFMNLLLNAIQAIEGKGTISIKTDRVDKGRRRSDAMVEIRIVDTGCGIDKKNLPRLFDPFFTTKPVGKGTGLGLSIVYDIITFHRGEVEVDSAPGDGTTVTLRLPVKTPRSLG
jgi:two-component system, NtrC family, sensor kinase